MAWEGASGRREQNHHRYIRMEALSEMMLVQKQGEEAEKTFCSLRQKPGSVSESSGLASVLLAFSRYVFCVSCPVARINAQIAFLKTKDEEKLYFSVLYVSVCDTLVRLSHKNHSVGVRNVFFQLFRHHMNTLNVSLSSSAAALVVRQCLKCGSVSNVDMTHIKHATFYSGVWADF